MDSGLCNVMESKKESQSFPDAKIQKNEQKCKKIAN
jgi:hypothetical protein